VKKSELVAYRLGVPADIAFIFATWLKGIRFGNVSYKRIPSKLYYTEMHAVLDGILQHPATVVNVACLKNEPDTILGFSVVTKSTTLHWVFVKKAWRGIGLGMDLTPLATVRVTMRTRAVDKILDQFPLIQVDLLTTPALTEALKKEAV
jgi:hypothetical protein